MTPEVSWASGLFDGEGYVSAHERPNRAISAWLRLENTDQELVEEFWAALEVGSVHLTSRMTWE